MNRRPRAAEELPAAIAQLLEHRAERLKALPQSAKDESLLWVAEFPVGDERYAISLDSLRAAVPLRMVTPVPLSAPHVIGILRFQGQLITALSLASLLGARGWRQDPAVLLVVDPGWGQLCALDCEEIPKPAALPLSVVEQARTRAAGRTKVLEVLTSDMRQISLLELNVLLDRRNAESRHGS